MAGPPKASLWAGLVLWALLSLSARGEAAERTHQVASGETLSGIAQRYGVTVDALGAKNGLSGDSIRAGQRLVIPAKGWKPGPTPSEASAKPASWTQVQKSPEERGGVNPCLTRDPGFGVYGKWQRGIGVGQVLIPQRGGITRSGGFDLMVHFHGHEAVRKEWVQVMDGAVLAAVDLGLGSGIYFDTFSTPLAFKQLIQNIENAVARQHGRKSAHVRKLGLSAWSAGYGAVQQIIGQSPWRERVDSVILLDGLHCGYVGRELNGKQIQPFLDWARRAARGEKFMFVSHSSIIPPGYSSTTETADLLVRTVGGRPRRARPRGGDPMGLDLVSRYSRGSFHVRGYAGNDKMDHCAHVGLYRDVLKVHIKARWGTPRGYRRGKTGS